MDVLLLTFANSETENLATLRKEDDQTHAVLRERDAREDFRVVREQYATREKIIALLHTYEQDICLFWYSGHANHRLLQLEDGNANAEGIAALLGRCPRLKLVGLNGCSTQAQTEALMAAGVPMVIATSAPVNDQLATQFSIAFFTELASNRLSVRKAFERAVETAQVFGKTRIGTSVRSAGREPRQEHNEAYWELVYAEKEAGLPDTWRLPEHRPDTPVNQHLQKALRRLFIEQRGDFEQADSPIDTLLKSLPFIISEPIRNLLAPSDGTKKVFYDRPSPQRCDMLLYAYQCMGNFLTYALWSGLWPLRSAGAALDGLDAAWEDFRQWLRTDIREDKKRSLLPVFQRLVAVYEQNGLPFPMTELAQALSKMADERYRQAFDYLEAKLQEPGIGRDENWERLCEETEKQLAIALYCFGFLFRYTLTSVKDIDVQFYIHQIKPNFVHKVVRLQTQTTELAEQKEVRDRFLKTAVVVLRHAADPAFELYMSPFLIDKNAYTRTEKANPHFFAAYQPGHRCFYYRSISRPEDDILTSREQDIDDDIFSDEADVEQDSNFFPLLYGQFAAYCETVFGKNLDEL